jgi:aminopeptidase N
VRQARALPLAVLLHVFAAGGIAAQADTSAPGHTPTHYDITLVRSDTGAHVLLEVETSWKLGSALPVIVDLDSTFRVIRALVDGKPNTRISRTQFARSPSDVLVPHEKAAGDTLTTRLRYHGVPRGGVRAGPNIDGVRTLVAETGTVDPAVWLPVPEPGLRTAKVTFHVQADSGERAIANGVLKKVDTLAYGHTLWSFDLNRTVPLTELVAAAGPYAIARLQSYCDPGPMRSSSNALTDCPMDLWTWSGDSAFAASGPFKRAIEIVDFFSANFGWPPYGAISHVEAAVSHPISVASVILYPEAALRNHSLDEATVARETARQWLRPDTPDSVSAYLAKLWTSSRGKKPPKPADFEFDRPYLLNP